MRTRLARALSSWWVTWCGTTAWAIPAVVSVIYSEAAPAPRRLRRSALRRPCFWGLVGAVVLAGAPILHAAPAASQASDKEEQVEERSVTGEVVMVSRRSISVEYARTQDSSLEMLLPLSDKTEVQGPKQLNELKPGDRVSVQFLQTYRVDDAGERMVLKTVATKVALLRSATGEGALRSADDTVSE